MLSDGDSVTFNAMANAQPYGEDRPVSKLDCVNHMHKRMGTALHKLATEEQLGSNGHSCLLLHKWDKLQGYFPTAVPNNPGSQEDLWNAVWASCFPIIHAHCGTAIWDNQGNLDKVSPKFHMMIQHMLLHVFFLGIQVYISILFFHYIFKLMHMNASQKQL